MGEAGLLRRRGSRRRAPAPNARAERERLLRALRREKLWPADDGGVPGILGRTWRAPCTCILARADAALVTVQLEDMIGMLEPVNVPGTSTRILQLDAPHDGERRRDLCARRCARAVRGHGRERRAVR